MSTTLNPNMGYVALVTILILAQYLFFTVKAGLARGKDGVKAPAMTGGEQFERCLRVQLNTLEQMAISIPAMWLCASFFRADVAAVFGITYLIGRFIYAASYVTAPEKRVLGMATTVLSNVILMLCALFGVIRIII